MSPERSAKDLFGPYIKKMAERVGFELHPPTDSTQVTDFG
jgi:hypothetical protein